MPGSPKSRRSQGPFVIPARVLLLLTGLLAIGLGLFNLYHEYHAHQVDGVYGVVGIVLALVWLVSLALGFLGRRLGVFIAGAIAFVQFAVLTSGHFVIGPNDIDNFWKIEGLPVATADMGLFVACVLVVFAAVVCWSTPRARSSKLDTVPVLIVALIGAVLVILQATDQIHRAAFDGFNAEDGTFIAAVLASTWLLGGLWIARVRRIGALVIAVATFFVAFSFLSQHLLPGATPIDTVAKDSGVAWAAYATGAFILAGASLLFSVGVLLFGLLPRRNRKRESGDEAVIRRRA